MMTLVASTLCEKRFRWCMRVLLILPALIALASCSLTHPIAHGSIGFRGANLGMPPLADMQLLEKWKPALGISSREVSDAYIRPLESKVLGSLRIKEVVYEYYDRQLFSIEVDLWTGNQTRCQSADEVISALEGQYKISMKRHQADYVKSEFLAQWRDSEAWVTYMCQPWSQTNMIMIKSAGLNKAAEDQAKARKDGDTSKSIEEMRRGL